MVPIPERIRHSRNGFRRPSQIPLKPNSRICVSLLLSFLKVIMTKSSLLRLLRVAILGGCAVLATNPRVGAFDNSNLTVTIDGIRSQRGQVCLSIFANSQGFPDRGANAVQARCIEVTDSTVVTTFTNLKPGSYAVAAFHDANNDGKLNRNVVGIPTEGFGFSQNPQIVAGPPQFGESAVLVAGTDTEIQIQLKYLLGG